MYRLGRMPNCDFFAMGDDHRLVLDYLFEQMPGEVFELSSALDSELRKFESVDHLAGCYGIDDWADPSNPSLQLQLHAAEAGGRVNLSRIDFDPEKFDGGKFRYSCEGWGLVQLYLENPLRGVLRPSHSNHNSEKRASRWAGTSDDQLGDPAEWNWKAVTAFSAKLNRFIRKTAVEKDGSKAVLPAASGFSRRGYK